MVYLNIYVYFFQNLFPTGTQACPKSKKIEDCGIQCNIANLPPLTLLHLPHKGITEDNGGKSSEPLPEEEQFEDADVDDEDYNPYQDSEGGFPLSRFCLRTLTYVKIENVRKSTILRA